MAAIEPHPARRPKTDPRWEPGDYPREELRRAVIRGGMAGVVSHPMDNVLWKIGLLCDGDPVAQFGLSGLTGVTRAEVLAMVGRASGFEPDPNVRWGPVRVDPEPVLLACEAVGDRLALACRRRERVVLATGHPTGLIQLYADVGRELAERGVTLLRPADGASWSEGGRHREIRYFQGVAVLTDRASALHTHSPSPMQVVLAAERPDLVFADHGWAGAAIEAGIDTISIADVNDPALIVAKELGRTQAVVVMDDNVRPDAYWPCFQAIVGRLP
ncbi:MAG: phosphatase [Actinomycetota bacterium]|nr:phosphatase [Actinomycetota bacterium]